MKVYQGLLDAIRGHMDWLESEGKLNLTELERAQMRAGLTRGRIISKEMLRLFRKGKIKTIGADRAEAFCRVMGMDVLILHRN